LVKLKRKRRKDGRFQDYVFNGYKSDGSEDRIWSYAYTETELEKKLLETRIKLAKGEYIKANNITVEEWAKLWLSTYKNGTEYKTFQMYDITVRKHIIDYLGGIKLTELKPFHIQGLINDRKARGLTKTLVNIKQTLNQMFEQAIENDLMIKNPVRKIKVVRPKATRRALDDEEIAIVRRANLTPKQKAFSYICLYAGTRRGEALALTKKDIDFKNGFIHINKTIVFKNNHATIKNHTKTEAGMRDIPIVDCLKTVLESYLSTVKDIYIFRPEKSNGLMTETAFRSMWDTIWRRLNKAAGGKHDVIAFPEITPHVLRHTYATMLYYAGVDLKQAQYLLGHASAEVTLNIYTHLDKKKSNPTEKLNAYFNVVNT